MCEDPECFRIYATNTNGISDSSGIKYDQTFLQMKKAEARIFAINETHVDQMNAKNNNVLKKSRIKMLQAKDGHYCKLVTSSSLAPITSYTKPGGNLM